MKLSKNYSVTEYRYGRDADGKAIKLVVDKVEIVSTSKQTAANEYFGVAKAVLSMSMRPCWTEGRGGRRWASIEIAHNVFANA